MSKFIGSAATDGMPEDNPRRRSFAESVLGSKDPAAILRAREKAQGSVASPRFYGCFIVAPLPERWELFTKRFAVATANPNCLGRYWQESVLPVLLREWTRPSVALRVGSGVEDTFPGLVTAFPRGVLVAQSGSDADCEIWHGGGLAGWMNVSVRRIEAAFDARQDWRWVMTEELSCIPENAMRAAELLAIKRRWWSEDGPSAA